MKYNLTFLITFLFLLSTSHVYAKNTTYDFNDPKGVNAISIVLNSTLEPMVGFATGVKGQVTVDHLKRKVINGRISVPTDSVTMSNGTMTKVLHSKDWLDAKKYPEITFKFTKMISIVKMTDEVYNITVMGDLTIKGITKEIKAPVLISFHPGKYKMRNSKGEGDLASIKTAFQINRSDFKIKPDTPTSIVAEIIELNMNIMGSSKK